MKKIIAIFTLCFMLLALGIPCAAADSGKLIVKSATASANENLVLEIAVSNNPGIIGAGFEISYDTEVLQLTKAENGQIFSSIYVQSQKITDEPYRMLWMDITAKTDKKADGTLMMLTFKVLKENRAATVKIVPLAGNIFNYDLQDRDIAGCSFSLKVGEGTNSSSASSKTEAPASSGTASVPKVDGKVELEGFKQLPVTEKVQNSTLDLLKNNTASTVSQGSQQAASQATQAALNSSKSATATAPQEDNSGATTSAVTVSNQAASAVEVVENSSKFPVLYAVLAISGVVVVVAVVIFVLKKKPFVPKGENTASKETEE